MDLASQNPEMAQNFFEIYQLTNYLDTKVDKKFYFGVSKNRICRFCNKSEPKTSFKKDAHIIPKLLGNTYCLSHFECDSCNTIFGIYESDLARYLGPIRSITSSYESKTRNPIFQHEDRSLKIKKSDNTVLVNGEVEDKSEEKIVLIPYRTQKFSPLNIYKALVKIAFCLMNEEEQKLFKDIPKFLLTTELDNDIRVISNARLSGYILGHQFSNPIVHLYKKKQSVTNPPIMEYILAIYFYQCMFHITLPLNVNDFWIYKGKEEFEISTYDSPAVFLQNNEYILLKAHQQLKPTDLSKSEPTCISNELILSYRGKYSETELLKLNEKLKSILDSNNML